MDIPRPPLSFGRRIRRGGTLLLAFAGMAVAWLFCIAFVLAAWGAIVFTFTIVAKLAWNLV
jgi:hypothetical protein